jgi:uncharacterized membrane protein YpjA
VIAEGGLDAIRQAGWAVSNEILQLFTSYSAAKRSLAEALGVTDDLLHVHVGMALFALTALLTRRRMRSWWPLGIVAAFAIGNEVIDYFANVEWSDQLSALDVANTLVWPLVLFLLARRGTDIGAKV